MSAIEVNPLFVQQAMAPNEIVMSVTIDVKFGVQSGSIEFCLPYDLLEPVLPVLSAHRWFSKKDDPGNGKSNANVASLFTLSRFPYPAGLGKHPDDEGCDVAARGCY